MYGLAGLLGGPGLGVLWFVWGYYGFWWGVLYGLFWPCWIGYHLAAAMLGPVGH